MTANPLDQVTDRIEAGHGYRIQRYGGFITVVWD